MSRRGAGGGGLEIARRRGLAMNAELRTEATGTISTRVERLGRREGRRTKFAAPAETSGDADAPSSMIESRDGTGEPERGGDAVEEVGGRDGVRWGS